MSPTRTKPASTRRPVAPAPHNGNGHNGHGHSGRKARAKTTEKWVYLFSEGDAGMRDLLGGKGANLAEMTGLGLPVPPGFVVTTRACNAYLAAGEKFPARPVAADARRPAPA